MMKSGAINQSRQTLFEAMVVYAKAESRNEYCVIYKNNEIRNLNAIDKLKISISNFFGYGKLNDAKAKLYSEAAKTHITTKLKENLLENLPKNSEIKNKNFITQVDLPYSIADDFLSATISHIKNKAEYKIQNTPAREITSNSGYTKEQLDELNSATNNLENISHSLFGHLPDLVKSSLQYPGIEKFLKILLSENNEEKVNALNLVSIAKQASKIKKDLGCDLKKAIEYTKKLATPELKNLSNDEYSESLKMRAINFAKAKKKFNLDGESAKNYSLLMENKKMEENKLTEKETLEVAHQFFLIHKKIIKSEKIYIYHSQEQLLDKVIENYIKNKNYLPMKKFLKKSEEILLPNEIERYAIEMTNSAYSSLTNKQKYSAAKEFIKIKDSAKIMNKEFIDKTERITILNKIKNEIHTIQPIDENGNYDQTKDENYYQQF